MSKKITVLYTMPGSIYNSLGCDCFDFERDALRWPGGNPVIAHPPCRAWGQLSHFANPRPGEKELALHALRMVRTWGGVLEHPRASRLFPKFAPYPNEIDRYGGYTISINQFWFGHKAVKNTFLYIVGLPVKSLPPMPLRFDAVEYVVSSSASSRAGRTKEITKKERMATPLFLAEWLIKIAESCKSPCLEF